MQVVSLNAGTTLGNSEALEQFILDLEARYPSWSLCFVSEVHALEHSGSRIFSCANSRVWEHHPGVGSRAMAWIVRNSVLRYVSDVIWAGRTGSVRLKPLSHLRKSSAVIGVHGSHSDLQSTFSELSSHFGSISKFAVGIVGDWNIDQLPLAESDPLSDVPARTEHHQIKRECLNQFMHDFGLELVLPICRHDRCDVFLSCLLEFSDATRIPIGNQHGSISLLDYGVGTPGMLTGGQIDWEMAPADHAGVVFDFSIPCLQAKHYPKRLWKCCDVENFKKDAESIFLDPFHSTDILALFTSLSQLQAKYQDCRTCSDRRKARMPFELRNAYKCFSLAVDFCSRNLWRSRIQSLRKKWLRDLKVQRHMSLALQGRASVKSKKLHTLVGIKEGGKSVFDLDRCAQLIAKHFEGKMASKQAAVREVLQNAVFAHDGKPTSFTEENIRSAINRLPRKLVIDHHGVSIFAFLMLFDVQPAAFTSFVNSFLGSSVAVGKLTVYGKPLGKTDMLPEIKDIRLILPQGSLMSILDVLLATSLDAFIDKSFPRTANDHVFVGARPKTQILDITFTCQTAVEKAIDNLSKGAIAQCDVEKYYDSLPIFKLFRWLINEGFNIAHACAIIRHQSFTTLLVSMQYSQLRPKVHGRCVGGLTGSRVAGALARIPTECMLRDLKHGFVDKCFLGKVSLGIFIDNFFSLGNSVTGAISILKDCEDYLSNQWSLKLKDSSLEVMPVFGYGDVEEFDGRWKLVSQFRALGHIIRSDASVDTCMQATLKAAWRQFWANIGKPDFRAFQLGMKLCRLKALVFPVINFRLSRWPFSASKAKQLDRTQRKMVGVLVNVCIKADESRESFWRRRNALVSACIPRNDKWSVVWAKRVKTWSDHVDRNSCGACWASNIAQFCTPVDLSVRRTLNYNRPAVRAVAGFTSLRWYESVSRANEWLETDK